MYRLEAGRLLEFLRDQISLILINAFIGWLFVRIIALVFNWYQSLQSKSCILVRLIDHVGRRSESTRKGGTLDFVSMSAININELHDMAHAYEGFTRHSRRVGRG